MSVQFFHLDACEVDKLRHLQRDKELLTLRTFKLHAPQVYLSVFVDEALHESVRDSAWSDIFSVHRVESKENGNFSAHDVELD